MDENKLIDGKKIAADLRAETAVKVEALKKILIKFQHLQLFWSAKIQLVKFM